MANESNSKLASNKQINGIKVKTETHRKMSVIRFDVEFRNK